MFCWELHRAQTATLDDDTLADLDADATFPTQAAAEAWLAERYEELSDAGVASVSLREADRVIYGPMSLAHD